MHGSGLTHIVWSLHEQFLTTKGYSILSVDLPGHGSSVGPGIKSIEEIAEWIKRLMMTLGNWKIKTTVTLPGGYVCFPYFVLDSKML